MVVLFYFKNLSCNKEGTTNITLIHGYNEKTMTRFLLLPSLALLLMQYIIATRSFPQDSPPLEEEGPGAGCVVEEKSSGTQKPCQFPFRMKNKVFDGCTTYKDKHQRLWCSTKVGDDGFHIGKKGFFGFCNPDTCKNNTVLSMREAADQFMAVQSEKGLSVHFS